MNLKTLSLALALSVGLLSQAAQADVSIDRNSLPKGFHITKIRDEDAARSCQAPRFKLVISNRCQETGKGKKFCLFDCVPKSDPRAGVGDAD